MHASSIRPAAARMTLTSLLAVLILTLGTLTGKGEEQEIEIVETPSQASLQRFVERSMGQQAGYQAGDLITRSQVKRLLQELAQKGWQVREADDLLQRVLADDDFLVRQLKDETGREFLQKIRDYPGGIDRLDRLSRLPQGEASVRNLIHTIPNGSEWIKGMTESRRGEIMGERLSNIEGVGDFNAPTGRIYELKQLIPEMHRRLEPASTPVSTSRTR